VINGPGMMYISFDCSRRKSLRIGESSPRFVYLHDAKLEAKCGMSKSLKYNVLRARFCNSAYPAKIRKSPVEIGVAMNEATKDLLALHVINCRT
jgi:hypothetical protein